MASVQFGNFRHLAWPMATRSASTILLIFLLACSPSKKGGSLHLVCEEKLRPGIEAVAKVFQVRYSAKVKIAWVDKIEGLNLKATAPIYISSSTPWISTLNINKSASASLKIGR